MLDILFSGNDNKGNRLESESDVIIDKFRVSFHSPGCLIPIHGSTTVNQSN